MSELPGLLLAPGLPARIGAHRIRVGGATPRSPCCTYFSCRLFPPRWASLQAALQAAPAAWLSRGGCL